MVFLWVFFDSDIPENVLDNFTHILLHSEKYVHLIIYHKKARIFSPNSLFVHSKTTLNPNDPAKITPFSGLFFMKNLKGWKLQNTLVPASNEFGYNEHPLTASRFLCIKIIDSNVKKFGYYEHPPTTRTFLFLVISGTQCIVYFLQLWSLGNLCQTSGVITL